MNIALYIARRLALAKKRRELRAIKEHLHTLYDQVASGEEGIRRYEARAARLEAAISGLMEPDEIVRRAVA